jgi:hypothetical protein
MIKNRTIMMSAVLLVTASIIVITPYLIEQKAVAQQPGYSLTVNVPSHEFEKSTVTISIKTANGYQNSRTVSTAGGASWTFDVPANEGDSVQVCVSGDIVGAILSLGNCKRFIVNGNDITVSKKIMTLEQFFNMQGYQNSHKEGKVFI